MRRRRILLWVAAVLAGGLVLLLATVLWLFHSESGRDFALGRAQSALDALGVEYQSIEGTIAGPLTLRGVRMDVGGTRVRADALVLDLAPSGLLARRLDVESLTGQGIEVQLAPAADEPDDAADEPFAFPDLELPVAVNIEAASLRDIVVHPAPATDADAEAATPLRISRLDFAARLDRTGTLTVPTLAIDSDRGRVRGDARIEFDGGREGEANLQVAGPAPDAPVAEVVLRSTGDSALATIALPDGDRLELRLDGEAWRVDSELVEVDPTPWWPAWDQGLVTLRIDAEGRGRQGTLSGEVAIAGEHLRIQPSQLALGPEGELLRAEPLVVTRMLDGANAGQLRLRGTIALSPEGVSDFTAELDAVVLPGEQGGRLDGTLEMAGAPGDYTLAFDGLLARPDMELPLRFRGRGNQEALQIAELGVSRDGRDTLAGSGRVQWAPAPAIELDLALAGFDPGQFLPDWPGAISGDAAVSARRVGEQWQAELRLRGLDGQLRGNAIAGEGELHWGVDGGRTDLTLAIGGGRLRVAGTAGETLDLAIDLSSVALGGWVPDVDGTLDGRVRLRGPRDAPRVELALQGEQLAFAGHTVEALEADGTLATAADGPFDLVVDATGLELGGIVFDRATIDVEGNAAAHSVELDLEGETLDLSLALEGARTGADWRGTLQRLQLVPGEGPAWTLRSPTRLALADGAWTLDEACLAGESMELCASASAAGGVQAAELSLEEMPLSALSGLLTAGQPVPWLVEGRVSAEATLRRGANGVLDVDAQLRLPQGSVALQIGDRPGDARELLEWSGMELAVRVRDQRLLATAEGRLEDTGRLALRLEGGVPGQADAAPLNGRLVLELPRLRVLELLTPHVSDPDGRLEADLTVAGSWEAPVFEGRAEATGLTAELPALGVTLRDSRLVASPAADGRLAISGALDTGEGVLEIDGSLLRGDDGFTAAVDLSGERVLVSDTPLARALVSPELDLAYSATDGLRIEGRVAIPEARLDLERLEGSVEPSEDVVVLDPRDSREEGGDMPVRAEVELVLGDDVDLQGFGFDGSISGTITVRERPGRVTTARGALDVTGEYTAYGQDLEIVEGRLLYSATPLDNPTLQVRAVREIREQTVGLRITGSASEPDLEIYADPPLEQAEAVSYLVLGRPLNSATSAESGQLSQAAAAIGGNFLAERLGGRLGFDTFEVGDSGALGGTAFTVGKYLSPKLYISYGVALFDEGEILTLRYLLTEHFEVELESGVESRAGVNYTIER